jgi:uncharacterized glyoxalase superfamily protein PhnB
MRVPPLFPTTSIRVRIASVGSQDPPYESCNAVIHGIARINGATIGMSDAGADADVCRMLPCRIRNAKGTSMIHLTVVSSYKGCLDKAGELGCSQLNLGTA